MSNKVTGSRRKSSVGMKAAFSALALTAGLALAAPSQAASVVLTYANMNTSYTGYITGPGGFSENAYIAPLVFDAYDASTHETLPDIIAFCVDIYHNIGLYSQDPDGAGPLDGRLYNQSTLTTNFSPAATLLSLGQKQKIGSLVNYGTYLYKTNASGNALDLAAIQGAIWEIANTGFNVGAGTLGNRVDYFVAHPYYDKGSTINLIVPNDHVTQSFAYAAVPEAATWAMMLIGFFSIGAALRGRKAAILSAI